LRAVTEAVHEEEKLDRVLAVGSDDLSELFRRKDVNDPPTAVGGIHSHHLGFGNFPRPVENLLSWTIEPNNVIPAGKDRQIVSHALAVAAELNGDRAVTVFFAVMLLYE